MVFNDIDDNLIKDVLQHGAILLKENGRIFIIISQRVMPRLEKLLTKYNVKHEILKQADIHNDGNMHYILELRFANL